MIDKKLIIKPGTTSAIYFIPQMPLDRVDTIYIFIEDDRTRRPILKIKYPDDTAIDDDGTIIIGLTQEDTNKLSEDFVLEAQYNTIDHQVSKSVIGYGKSVETLDTEFLPINPSDFTLSRAEIALKIAAGVNPQYIAVAYKPSVSEDGIISWTNQHGLPNPDPVDIKGPKGDKGDPYTESGEFNTLAEEVRRNAGNAAASAGSAAESQADVAIKAQTVLDSVERADQEADRATAEAVDAKRYKEEAEAAKQAAAGSESRLTQMEQTVKGYKDDAETAASSAQTQAENAAASAMAASNSASAASGYLESVSADAQAAAASAEEAAGSALEALRSKAAAAASALASANSEEAAAQALADLLRMLGSDIPVAGADGKIPISYIPATAIHDTLEVTSEDELTGLTAQRGDVAELIEAVDGEKTVTKSWQLLGTADPSIRENWIVWGTSYAVKAGNATAAEYANNASMINGHRIVNMTKEQFDLAVKDAETYYTVYDPSAEE